MREKHRASDRRAPIRDLGVMQRRVVLHLLSGREVVAARRYRGLVADAVSSTEGGQSLVAQLRSERRELLVHAYEVALAGCIELQNLRAVRLRPLGVFEMRHLRAAVAQHALDRAARNAKSLRDRARPVPPCPDPLRVT